MGIELRPLIGVIISNHVKAIWLQHEKIVSVPLSGLSFLIPTGSTARVGRLPLFPSPYRGYHF